MLWEIIKDPIVTPVENVVVIPVMERLTSRSVVNMPSVLVECGCASPIMWPTSCDCGIFFVVYSSIDLINTTCLSPPIMSLNRRTYQDHSAMNRSGCWIWWWKKGKASFSLGLQVCNSFASGGGTTLLLTLWQLALTWCFFLSVRNRKIVPAPNCHCGPKGGIREAPGCRFRDSQYRDGRFTHRWCVLPSSADWSPTLCWSHCSDGGKRQRAESHPCSLI